MGILMLDFQTRFYFCWLTESIMNYIIQEVWDFCCILLIWIINQPLVYFYTTYTILHKQLLVYLPGLIIPAHLGGVAIIKSPSTSSSIFLLSQLKVKQQVNVCWFVETRKAVRLRKNLKHLAKRIQILYISKGQPFQMQRLAFTFLKAGNVKNYEIFIAFLKL